MTLEHILVEICREENAVGGIMAAALCNRARARLIAENGTAPSQDIIEKAIFELISNEALIVTDSKRLRAKNTAPSSVGLSAPRRTPQNGDVLFNEDGEPVCMITCVTRSIDQAQLVEHITVQAIVDLSDKERYAGKRDTHIHGYNDIPMALQRATGGAVKKTVR